MLEFMSRPSNSSRTNSLTIFEFDKIVEAKGEPIGYSVPSHVFTWLEIQCLGSDESVTGWLKLTQLRGQRAIQVTSYVGVIRAPCGFQIEVLPKTGRNTSPSEARALLIQMLKCQVGFRHIQTESADLSAERMPLLEVFIQQFLLSVEALVKRGLRSDYISQRENLFTLRGRLLVAQHVSQNLLRRDRFFTEHDEFSLNRAENRLIHTALRQVLTICKSQENQRSARELSFVFSDVPLSVDLTLDVQRIRLERGMGYYEHALEWAKLILQDLSPTASFGKNYAPSLLFPMEAIFEAYVAKHLSRQLQDGFVLKSQTNSQHLVTHENQNWFRLKPDLLVSNGKKNHVVLDTKWKLIDVTKKNGREKYQLSQADFYQLFAYGHHYLNGSGNIILIYPKTDAFCEPLPTFAFPKSNNMRLWVLPFCHKQRQIILPDSKELSAVFSSEC